MAAQETPYWDAFRDTAMGKYLLDHEQAFIAQHVAAITRPFRLLEICSCTHPRSHPAVLANALELPFAAESFDGVVAIQCFRYFDPVEFLQACHRVLKPDGWLFLQAVNRSSYKRMAKRLIKRSAKRNVDVFTAGNVLALLADSGFDVRTVRGYNWLPFAPRITRMSNSRLIRYAARFEIGLHLERLYRISPWILVAARRTG